jgi:phage FluMu protein Com
MDQTRCPKCHKRLMAMTDRTGRTELRCLKCDKVDPMKTDAVKWAGSPLATPTKRRPDGTQRFIAHRGT